MMVLACILLLEGVLAADSALETLVGDTLAPVLSVVMVLGLVVTAVGNAVNDAERGMDHVGHGLAYIAAMGLAMAHLVRSVAPYSDLYTSVGSVESTLLALGVYFALPAALTLAPLLAITLVGDD